MKRLVPLWRRPRRGSRMLVFTLDRPRRIDRVIDFFGDRSPAAISRLSMARSEDVPRMTTR